MPNSKSTIMKRKVLITMLLGILITSSASAQVSGIIRLLRIGAQSSRVVSPAIKTSSRIAPIYGVSRSTTISLQYSDDIYKSLNSPSYPTQYEEFLKDLQNKESNNVYNLKFDNSINVADYFHKERIASSQKFLRAKGYYTESVDGSWDDETKKALLRYINAQISELKAEELLKIYENIPPELLTHLYQKKSYNPYYKNNITTRLVESQHALKKLGYYSSNVDGIYGPLTNSALILFESDYKLKNIEYLMHYNIHEDVIKIEFNRANDFVNYWKKASEDLYNCSPSLCLTEDQVSISLECNGQTIEFSTKGCIKVTASNGVHKKDYTFGKNCKDETCVGSAKICYSKKPNVSIDFCDISVNASSGGLEISSVSGGITRTAKIF